MNMEENKLKHINGKKIRRQYFNIPLIFLYTIMLAVPYFILICSVFMGDFDFSEWGDAFWTSIWIYFVFSLPFLLLRTLNKHFFGRIICVMTEDGIHYPKGMVRWETIAKIEYAMDAKPRYKNDSQKSFRAIIYTQGGKHIVLNSSPLCLLSRAKKFKKELDIKIAGLTSFMSVVLIMSVIILLCPFYCVLLINASGPSLTQIIVMCVVALVFGVFLIPVNLEYHLKYRFWRRILPIKWLSYIILGTYYISGFAALLILFYFPNWVVVALLGIYLGIVHPPMPSRNGGYHRKLHSYQELCDIYITRADFWENEIKKRNEKTVIRKIKSNKK